nr:hypothetical protein [uncultured Kingella sp.]
MPTLRRLRQPENGEGWFSGCLWFTGRMGGLGWTQCVRAAW